MPVLPWVLPPCPLAFLLKLMVSSNLPKIAQFERINQIDPQMWDACVGEDNPFATHAFLCALEDSRCVHPDHGWLPQHLVLTDDSGQINACTPLYLKSHSYGEYVFDWSWAEAYERAGGRYYPKLLCAIPFTPVSGQRLLTHADCSTEDKKQLLTHLLAHADKIGVSSLHINFAQKKEWEMMQDLGMLGRIGHQYHWTNHHYENFDDFLNALSSRKRKAIRKERKAVIESGIKLTTLSGPEIQEHHWDAFYDFYLDTSGRKWGHPYLNRDFFSLLGQRLGDQTVLVLALQDQRIVAGALNLKGNDTLFGRYWGCLEDYRFLHFEACYYQAIDYAIANRLKRVEAGAQGQHKIQRGYLPVETYSAHWIANPSFRNAVDDFLEHDKTVNRMEMQELMKLSPYKTDSQ
ncbi:GNAT family N-acetyltransferase [Terasakiella brassicae]|uniref:GNAT family N-acetyltransferase n=1 Tax=Terasakiella brassicae TaxID=1634917 RepID=UPI001E4084C4|nr:GNAT family N-acetyltransferase [Terasakiella brassicae]